MRIGIPVFCYACTETIGNKEWHTLTLSHPHPLSQPSKLSVGEDARRHTYTPHTLNLLLPAPAPMPVPVEHTPRSNLLCFFIDKRERHDLKA